MVNYEGYDAFALIRAAKMSISDTIVRSLRYDSGAVPDNLGVFDSVGDCYTILGELCKRVEDLYSTIGSLRDEVKALKDDSQ